MGEEIDLRIGDREFPLGGGPVIMGIINITPDSFSDGGLFHDPARAAEHARNLVDQGAHLLDLGAESTRPGSAPVDEALELERLLPCLRAIREAVDVPLSIDTYKAGVAEAALEEGAHMINDITGLAGDPRMAATVARYQVPLVIMHRRPFDDPYPGPVWDDIIPTLAERVEMAEEAGIPRERIIVDPGFGFGKTDEQNLQLIMEWDRLRVLGCRVLLGPSRKSSIGRILGLPAHQRLEGTLALASLAAARGVDFLRVHDVGPVVRAVTVAAAAGRAAGLVPGQAAAP